MEKDKPRGLRPPLDPRGNVLGHSDVLCANRLAMVRVTRLRRLRRSAYPLASACCAAQKDSKTYATAQLPTTNLAGYSLSSNIFAAVGAVQSSPAEAVLSAMKLPKKGGAWLSGEAA